MTEQEARLAAEVALAYIDDPDIRLALAWRLNAGTNERAYERRNHGS